jgi:hypothetical protein
VTQRPPLWTAEDARADAEREGQPEESSDRKLAGCLADSCLFDGCLALVPVGCLVVALMLWLR